MKKSSSLVCLMFLSKVFVGAVFPPYFRQPSTIFGLSSLLWNLKVLQTQCAKLCREIILCRKFAAQQDLRNVHWSKYCLTETCYRHVQL